jgi:excisionase family DNA binding protein
VGEASVRRTVKEAADYIRCGVSTLNKLRVKGGGPRYIKIGGKILYDDADIDKWLDDHKRGSTSDEPRGRKAA